MTPHNGKQLGTIHQQAIQAELLTAIKVHRQSEIVSFHTPGHKGYANPAQALVDDLQNSNRLPRGAELETAPWLFDVTELPGLDELSQPTGVLFELERRAARLWGAEQSFLSVNGASAALMAAISACASRGTKILVPRNCHRSVINALVITGLTPIWYEPDWNPDWSCWSSANEGIFAEQLNLHGKELACALVVSPTYAGAFSNISALSSACKKHDVPLIVDEAHGAHLLPGSELPISAVASGADMVVHSLHKTLAALTQTGLLHRMQGCLLDEFAIRASLNLVQSSSPSYLLMASIEQSLIALESPQYLARIEAATRSLRLWLNKDYITYSQDPAHVLIKLPGMSASDLYDQCCRNGVYPEAIIGNGVLLLFSPHTTSDHTEVLLSVLDSIAKRVEQRRASLNGLDDSEENHLPPPSGQQIISPRQAFFSKTELIPINTSAGRIAAECLAPCPPGTPIIVPGQRINEEIIQMCTGKNELRVVLEVDTRKSADTQICAQNPRKRRRASE